MPRNPTSNLSEEEWEQLDQDLRNINGCDLSTWDQEFLTDMSERVATYGTVVRITPRQWARLQRLREQYL